MIMREDGMEVGWWLGVCGVGGQLRLLEEDQMQPKRPREKSERRCCKRENGRGGTFRSILVFPASQNGEVM